MNHAVSLSLLIIPASTADLFQRESASGILVGVVVVVVVAVVVVVVVVVVFCVVVVVVSATKYQTMVALSLPIDGISAQSSALSDGSTFA